MKQTVEHVFYSDYTSHPIVAPSKEQILVETRVESVYDKESGYTHIKFKYLVSSLQEHETFEGFGGLQPSIMFDGLKGDSKKNPGPTNTGKNPFT